MEKYSDALNDLNQAIELNQYFAPLYANRSLVNHYLGKYQEALVDAFTFYSKCKIRH
jgi:lipoprotein NlpI